MWFPAVSTLIFRASSLSGNPWKRLAVAGTACHPACVHFQYVQHSGPGIKKVLRMRFKETPQSDGVPLPIVLMQWLRCNFSKLGFLHQGDWAYRWASRASHSDMLKPKGAGVKGHEIVPKGALSCLPADVASSSSQCVGMVCTYVRIFW